MKEIIKCTFYILIGIYLMGCSVRLANESKSFQWSLHNENMYTFKLKVTKDFFVRSNSIKTFIYIDGVKYSMNKDENQKWVYEHQGSVGFNVKYESTYTYLAVPLPILLPGKETLPVNGTLYINVTPDIAYSPPNNLLMYFVYSEPGADYEADVHLSNQSEEIITITEISIKALDHGRPTGSGAPPGNWTGSSFSIANAPAVGHQLNPGDTVAITLSLLSTEQSYGLLFISLDQNGQTHRIEIPIEGKIVVL